MKPTVTIHDWSIVGTNTSAWLVGETFEHPAFGKRNKAIHVQTSPIIGVLETGEIETLNTVYQLQGPMKIIDAQVVAWKAQK